LMISASALSVLAIQDVHLLGLNRREIMQDAPYASTPQPHNIYLLDEENIFIVQKA
jgi:hypothetical protein